MSRWEHPLLSEAPAALVSRVSEEHSQTQSYQDRGLDLLESVSRTPGAQHGVGITANHWGQRQPLGTASIIGISINHWGQRSRNVCKSESTYAKETIW